MIPRKRNVHINSLSLRHIGHDLHWHTVLVWHALHCVGWWWYISHFASFYFSARKVVLVVLLISCTAFSPLPPQPSQETVGSCLFPSIGNLSVFFSDETPPQPCSCLHLQTVCYTQQVQFMRMSLYTVWTADWHTLLKVNMEWLIPLGCAGTVLSHSEWTSSF